MNRNTKRIVALGTPIAAVAAAGIAFAAWTANGSGSGNASANTAKTITLDVTGVNGSGDMYPGGYGAVSFNESNTNAYAVTFDTVSSVSVTSVQALPSKTCSTSDFTAASSPVALANADKIHAAAGDSAVLKTIPASYQLVQLNHTALDGCQGATVTLSVALTGSQD